MSKYPLIEKMGLQLYVWGEHFKMPQGQIKYPSGNGCVSADELERKLSEAPVVGSWEDYNGWFPPEKCPFPWYIQHKRKVGRIICIEPIQKDTAESLLREFVEIKTDQYPTAGRLDALLDRARNLLRESK